MEDLWTIVVEHVWDLGGEFEQNQMDHMAFKQYGWCNKLSVCSYHSLLSEVSIENIAIFSLFSPLHVCTN